MVLTPIQRFYNSNTNPITRQNYKFQFDKFLKWGKFTPEVFLKMDKTERQDEVLQYIQSWKAKTEKWGTPAPSSYTSLVASIMSFCEANELDMNWKLIKKTIPKITQLSNQYPYTNEDIEKYLSVAGNLRDIAFIHLMASTAPRIGEVNQIKIKDVVPIEDGAILRMYAGQIAEYRVPITPESYHAIKNYLDSRISTEPHAPLIATNGLTERPMKAESVKEFMKRFRNKIENLEKDGKRKDKAPNNAFRKRLQICYSMGKIDYRFADYFLNHNLGKQDPHYFRRMTDEQIWEAFRPAIPCITLDKSLKIEAQKNEEIKTIKESYDGELKEKLESLEGQLVEMKKERAGKVIEFYDDLAERKGVDEIEEIKTKLDDKQIKEITESREILNQKPLEITPSQDMLRRKYLISKQESVISSLKKELEELAKIVPKRKSPDKMTDEEFDFLEDYEDKILEIELAEEFLVEMKRR